MFAALQNLSELLRVSRKMRPWCRKSVSEWLELDSAVTAGTEGFKNHHELWKSPKETWQRCRKCRLNPSWEYEIGLHLWFHVELSRLFSDFCLSLLPDLSHCLFDLYIHLKMFLVGFRLYPFKFAQVFPNYGKNKSSILERFAEQMELKIKMLKEFLSGQWVYFMRGTRRVCIKDKQQVSQTWIKLSPTPKRKYWIKFMSGTGLNPCLGTWVVWFKKMAVNLSQTASRQVLSGTTLYTI